MPLFSRNGLFAVGLWTTPFIATLAVVLYIGSLKVQARFPAFPSPPPRQRRVRQLDDDRP
jgi:hypothetical protein